MSTLAVHLGEHRARIDRLPLISLADTDASVYNSKESRTLEVRVLAQDRNEGPRFRRVKLHPGKEGQDAIH